MSTPMDESFDIDPRAFLAEADGSDGRHEGDRPDEVTGTSAHDATRSTDASDAVPAGDGTDAGIDALQRIAGELTAVDLALLRLDDGRYATCEVCGGAVADDRLAVDPTERFCAAHSPPSTG